jgi:cytosine/adenosine deaminase-related metal-dependent hydrolase/SAM-dependent methyltransferase
MANSLSTRCVSPEEGYRLWSRVYDSQPNPMLSLEERYLAPLLPPLNGLDVLDLGCGTGRWLDKFAHQSPRSLIGVDASAEMLERAAEKVGGRATLLNNNCERPPLEPSSADLVLCSFLASYISDLDRFAGEVRRIARPGADIFITDVHPLTQSTLGWRRGFRLGDTHFDVSTLAWSLAQVLSAFENAGLRLAAILEPCFDAPEFRILERAGKSGSSAAMRRFPAIYILQFTQAAGSAKGIRQDSSGQLVESIHGARIALGPQESVSVDLRIAGDRISWLGSSPSSSASAAQSNSSALNLNGCLVFPGLINAHDHLEFALFPRLGKGGYHNFSQWARDIHLPDSSPVREHRSVPKTARLWWGGIRNLLSGVTTVCHHNPYHSDVFENNFPVRVLRDFHWAHSLAMDANAFAAAQNTPLDQPFILHLAEGTDAQSAQEIFDLDRAGALDNRTVVVHALGLDEPGLALLKSRRASLVWCPTSNHFLFGTTHSRQAFEALPSVALGSDSPLTAAGDLLDELRFAREHVGISAEALYAQITTAAAQILRLHRGEGSLRIGTVADLIAVRDSRLSPAETLARCSYREIELVILAGRIQLASPQLFEKLPLHLVAGLELLDVDGCVRWIRAPVRRLTREASAVLGDDFRLAGRKVRKVDYDHAA